MYAPAIEISERDRASLMRVIQQSLGVKDPVDVLLWLQGEVQELMPHDILIAAWGNFSLGLVDFDVMSSLPNVRTDQFSALPMVTFVRRLFTDWSEAGNGAITLEAPDGFPLCNASAALTTARAVRRMTSAMVHGIKDERGRQDCLYVALRAGHDDNPRHRARTTELLLPYVDALLRRVHAPEDHAPVMHCGTISASGEESHDAFEELGLSVREIEIMDWVRQGKTNHEIGMILNISVFTVKNHLQRIFKKLDVLNRAQAVARLSLPMGRTRA